MIPEVNKFIKDKIISSFPENVENIMSLVNNFHVCRKDSRGVMEDDKCFDENDKNIDYVGIFDYDSIHNVLKSNESIDLWITNLEKLIEKDLNKEYSVNIENSSNYILLNLTKQ